MSSRMQGRVRLWGLASPSPPGGGTPGYWLGPPRTASKEANRVGISDTPNGGTAMRGRQTDPNLGRAGKSFPTLEALEDRTCPSSISLSGHALLISGDNTANLVNVLDGGHGNVTASVRDANGHLTTRAVTGVQSITINTA